MKLLRALLLVSLLIALTSTAEGAAGCKKQKKKHQHHAIHGVVVAVQHKTSLSGTITVQVHHHKAGLKKKGAANQQANANAGNAKVGKGKKGAPAARPAAQGQAKAPAQGKRHEHLKTFQVSRETKFEKEVRTGAGIKKGKATFSEVHKGTHVTIHAHHHNARKVEIHPQKMKQRAKRPPGLPPRKRPK